MSPQDIHIRLAASTDRAAVLALAPRLADGWARDRGLAHLTLHTGAYNATARAFYAALGFAEEEVRLTRRVDGFAAHPGEPRGR